MTLAPDLVALLDEEATRMNTPAFIADDPVQFPRRFDNVRDIEIVSLLAATIAWGNRKMICRNADRLLSMMGHEPYRYVMEKGYEDLDDSVNIHRTFFGRNLKQFLGGLHAIYRDHGSLDDFSRSIKAGDSEAPAWYLVEAMQRVFTDANGGVPCQRCLPQDIRHTALKRINMALRWLVRDDGIVDMGVWTSIPKSKLFIPLDVHVGNTARDLGLLTRKANDRRAVEELTGVLAQLRPDDPAWYDYALFGIGITAKNEKHESNRT